MRTKSLSMSLLTGILLASTVGIAAAQTASDGPTTQQPDPPAGAEGQADASGSDMPEGMMGMMTPEMMQMMMRMMRQGMMAEGMTSEGMMEERGMPGMMREGMPRQGMGPGMMGQRRMGGGMTMGMPGGDPLLYGSPRGTPEEMTPERVRELLEQRLEYHGNPRLTLGEIAEADDGSITAEIVTIDGALVQKLAFNRYPGLVRQLDD